MPPRWGSIQFSLFTQGSRPGLLMWRPAGARFCGGVPIVSLLRCLLWLRIRIYWIGRIIMIDFDIWCELLGA